MSDRYTIAALSELLMVARDGERGFHTCAQHVRSDSLRKVFTTLSDRCTAAVAELTDLIGRLGGDLGVRCVIPGATRRGWVNLHAALALNDDSALVDECESGEDHALEVYRNALDDPLPELVRQVVLRQFERLMNDHDQFRILPREPSAGGAVIASFGGHARQ